MLLLLDIVGATAFLAGHVVKIPALLHLGGILLSIPGFYFAITRIWPLLGYGVVLWFWPGQEAVYWCSFAYFLPAYIAFSTGGLFIDFRALFHSTGSSKKKSGTPPVPPQHPITHPADKK